MTLMGIGAFVLDVVEVVASDAANMNLMIFLGRVGD
jgi:hypothetical protein